MGVLFAIGSTLFLIPAIASINSKADWIGITFFCGSIFFTSASLVQFVTASEVPHGRRVPASIRRHPRRWMPARADWASAAIQLPGTVFFNVNTFVAMNDALTRQQVNIRVWAPDMIGSACFLVSSLIAFANVEHRWLSWRPGDLDWWITGLNLLGSVFFGFSAVFSFERPATGDEASIGIAAAGTAAGALCFLIASILLLPAAAREQR
jgi:hypothetical protein